MKRTLITELYWTAGTLVAAIAAIAACYWFIEWLKSVFNQTA